MSQTFEVASVHSTKATAGEETLTICVLRGPAELLEGQKLAMRQSGRRCPLSERVLEVVKGLAAGETYQQIALRLGVSASTVRTHCYLGYQAVGATNGTQLVLLCEREGWLDDERLNSQPREEAMS